MLARAMLMVLIWIKFIKYEFNFLTKIEGEKKKVDANANSQKQDFDLSHLISNYSFSDYV